MLGRGGKWKLKYHVEGESHGEMNGEGQDRRWRMQDGDGVAAFLQLTRIGGRNQTYGRYFFLSM